MHSSLFLSLACIIAFAKLGGELCERYLRQPAVLAEILVGVLLGKSVLGWVDGENATLQHVAEIGAVLLLFEVGLESHLDALLDVGKEALWVAAVGVICPFGLGYFVALGMGMPVLESLFVGAMLTATSVGITARVFTDLKILDSREATIVLGAAIVDDVIGLVILATVSGLAATKSISMLGIGKTSLLAMAYLVGAIVLGLKATPILLRWAGAMRTRAAMSMAAIVLCLLAAASAEYVGLAAVVGAFACGLVLAKTEHKMHFEDKVRSLADLFIPVFFVVMGARLNLGAFTWPAIQVGLLLLLVAVVGKLLGGLTMPGRVSNRWIVSIGMLPRGEVGLIFAGVALSAKVFDEGLYAAVVFVVFATTFLTPPLLRFVTKSTALAK